jgi:hypothetical protein
MISGRREMTLRNPARRGHGDKSPSRIFSGISSFNTIHLHDKETCINNKTEQDV